MASSSNLHPIIQECNRKAEINPAQFVGFDVKALVRTTVKLLEEGDDYRRVEDLENAYIKLFRGVTIYIDIIRPHKGLSTAKLQIPNEIKDLDSRVVRALTTLEDIRAKISKRPHAKYQSSSSNAKAATSLSSSQNGNVIRNDADLDFLANVSAGVKALNVNTSSSSSQQQTSSSSLPLQTASENASNVIVPSPSTQRHMLVSAEKVYEWLTRAHSTVFIIIDVRPSTEFYAGHMKWFKESTYVKGNTPGGVINLEPSVLRSGITTNDIQAMLQKRTPSPHPTFTLFSNRREARFIVYMDSSSSTLPKSGEGTPMANLLEALWEREFMPNPPQPVMLIGGYNAWSKLLKSKGVESNYTEYGDGTGCILLGNNGSSTSNGSKENLAPIARGPDEFVLKGRANSLTGQSDFATQYYQNYQSSLETSKSHISPTRTQFEDWRSGFNMISHNANTEPLVSRSTPRITDPYSVESLKALAYPTVPSVTSSVSASLVASQPSAPPLPPPPIPQHQQEPLPPARPTTVMAPPLQPLPTPTQLQTSPPFPRRSTSLSAFNNNITPSAPTLPPPPAIPPKIAQLIPNRTSSPSLSPSAQTYFHHPSSTSLTTSTGMSQQYNPTLINQQFQTTPSSAFMSSLSSSTTIGSSPGPLKGLRNLGNTCFLNSTLQCLSGTVPLSRYFLSGEYRKAVNRLNPMGSKGVVVENFADLVRSMWTSEDMVVNPSRFKEAICVFAPQFKGTEQHDSQEFLAFLLDGLHEDMNMARQGHIKISDREDDDENDRLPDFLHAQKSWEKYMRLNRSVIVELFQGQLKNELTCLTCSKKSVSFNPFMYLSLPIQASRRRPSVSGSHLTLFDCLDAFVEEEILDGTDAWVCPRCKAPRRARKCMSIAKLPMILLVHLKRFYFQGPFRNKIDAPVDYPFNMDLTSYVPPDLRRPIAQPYPSLQPTQQESFRYNLYAVSNHYGGLNGGHYTAAVWNGYKQQWYQFDDSRVSPCHESEVKSKAGYILFYVRTPT